MENMETVFLEEANELLGNLEGALLQLDQTPDEKSLIEEVFRSIHTLKGNSSMLGYGNIAEFIHNLETLYDLIRDGKQAVSKDIINVTLTSMDHVRNIVPDPELSDPANRAQHDELSSRILSLTIGVDEIQPEDGQQDTGSSEVSNDNISTYFIHFKPGKKTLVEGNNPLYLIDELGTMGQIKAFPYLDQVKDLSSMNPTDCISGWSVFLSTDKGQADISDVFVFVKENSILSVEKLSDNNLLKEPLFMDQLEGVQTQNLPLDLNSLNLEFTKEELSSPEKEVSKQDLQPEVKGTTKKESSSTKRENGISSIRVSSDKLDDLMNLVSELITTQAALTLHSDRKADSELNTISENVEKLSKQLRDIAFGMTLVPINSMFGRFQRMVRDISQELGKEVAFINEGGETELDKSIIERLADPLMHILRNSLDHGIESKAERAKAGKPEKGSIVLKAYYSGTNVNIDISDDGKGINPDVIKAKAVEKGIIQEDDVLSDKEAFDLIFNAGFSTAQQVTEVSGRGVGMDVVKRNIMNLRGEVDIKSEVGVGTTLTISLPLSLSIIDGLLVKLGQGSFIIPVAVIDKCYTQSDEVQVNKFTNIMEIDKEQIPFIDPRNVFNIQSDIDNSESDQIVVVNNGATRVGIICDHIIGEYQAVIKPLGPHFKNQDHISGSTILGDGSIALVFDTNRLIKKHVTRQKDTNLL